MDLQIPEGVPALQPAWFLLTESCLWDTSWH